MSHSVRLQPLLLLTGILAAATLQPGTARAGDQVVELSPQIKYRQATEAFQRRDYREAKRLLLELWQHSKSYDVALTLGQTEYQLQNHGAAADYLSFAIKNFQPAEKAEVLEGLKADFAELRKVVGVARITVNRPAAEVTIDGSSGQPFAVRSNVV
jgi:hypothetical protein